MVKSSSEFSAAFNQACSYKSNTFHVSDTFFNKQLLELLTRHRYVFFYQPSSTFQNKLIVFPNYTAINFRLRNISLPSRKVFVTSKSLTSSLNAGRLFVLRTQSGFEFSNFFAITRRHKSIAIFELILALCMRHLITVNTEVRFLFVKAIQLFSPSLNLNFFYDRRFFGSNFFVSKSAACVVPGVIEGLYTSLTSGYFSILHVKGIGFKVYYHSANHSLYFLLGYNHVTKLVLPIGVTVKVRKQYLLLFSADSSALGKYDFLIRSLRIPDPYRGKGIRYRYQVIKFKPGKQR